MVSEVVITDVVLRDGLQDEPVVVPVEDRLRIAGALVAAGIVRIEVASFVNPARVPQMAGAQEMVRGLSDDARVRAVALALNARGIERAATAGATEVVIVASASQGHSRANAGRSTEEVLADLARAVSTHDSLTFQGAVSTAFVCPFDGEVPAERVVDVAAAFREMGIRHIGLADTLGVATPEHVAATTAVVGKALSDAEFSLHLHDGQGQALRTVDLAIELGVTHFDAAAGGYGGCPFAPGAHGNIATEKLVGHLHSRGIGTGIDLPLLGEAVDLVKAALAAGTPVG